MRDRVIAAFLWMFLVPLSLTHARAAENDTPGTVAALATVSTGTPSVEIPEIFFDFGEVKDVNDYVHAFSIWNTGTGILEIQKVLPG